MKRFIASALCATTLVFGGERQEPGNIQTYSPQIESVEDLDLYHIASLSRRDSIPPDHLENVDDFYLEGYIQALIDTHYYEMNVLVYVDHGVVYLYNLPKSRLISNSIISFVKDVPSVKEVKETDTFPDKELEIQEKYEVRNQIKGIWFPQSTVLYQPMIANPRYCGYSLGMRFGDQVIGNTVVQFSLGDIFPIFRWTNVWGGGDLQLDIVGCMWAVFSMWEHNNPNDEISTLVTTDYMGALQLSYAIDNWSFRLRAYHVSSHLGDEFMVKYPDVQRLNPSMEAIDFFTNYQLTEGLRLFAGPGWVFHSDNTFKLDPFYIEWGGELRLLGHKSYYHKLYGTPVLAMFFRNWQTNHWKLDATYALGYEWSKLQGVGRKFRILGEYHHGYSEGQFFKEDTTWGAILIEYGF